MKGTRQPGQSRGGMGLVELIVVAALLSILSLLLASFLRQSANYTAQTVARSSLHQQALAVVNLMAADLRRAGPESIGLRNAPTGDPYPVTLELVRATGASVGRTLWEEKAILYVWEVESRTLWRKEWPPGPPVLEVALRPNRPARFSDSDLGQLAAARCPVRRVLTRDLRRLEIDLGAGGNPVTVKVHLARQAVAGQALEQATTWLTVRLRN